MIFKPLTMFLIGTGVLATTGAIAVQSAISSYPIQVKLLPTQIAVQATTNSHTIQGKLTSRGASTASVPCNQISVRSEVWTEPEEKDPAPIEKSELGSTKAQGTTLGNGCSYMLTFNPLNFLGELSYYRLVAETPKNNGKYVGQYRPMPASRLPRQYDLKF